MSDHRDAAAEPDPPTQSLAGKELVVAVCGSIAAYKTADVVSKLVQRGAGVTVVMTDAATQFVGKLTFEALSGRSVRVDHFNLVDPSDTQHIGLTEKAQLILVAPATGNMLAKVAHGLCDDLVSTMISAAACPVVFAPAMNHRMWDHPATQDNVSRLKRFGYAFIGPESGWLACRNVGAGRLTEPSAIVEKVTQMLTNPNVAQGPSQE